MVRNYIMRVYEKRETAKLIVKYSTIKFNDDGNIDDNNLSLISQFTRHRIPYY